MNQKKKDLHLNNQYSKRKPLFFKAERPGFEPGEHLRTHTLSKRNFNIIINL